MKWNQTEVSSSRVYRRIDPKPKGGASVFQRAPTVNSLAIERLHSGTRQPEGIDSQWITDRMRFSRRPPLILLVLFMVASPRSEADAGQALVRSRPETTPYRYQVQEGCHLKEVSLRLYGTSRHWMDIARWNDIQGPRFVLRRGQWLLLKKSPTLSPEEGEQRVLDLWRKRFGLDSRTPRDLPRTGTRPSEPPTVVREKFEKEEEVLQLRAAAEGLGPSREEIRSEESRSERFQKAQAWFKGGNFAGALGEFHALRIEDASKPEFWLREIATLISLGRTGEARSLARKFADERPELSTIPFIVRLISDAPEDGTP